LKLAPPEARMLVMQEMHAVDLLNQHLDALRGIATRLGEAAAHADLISLGPVLGPVTLGEVVRRVEASVSGEACEAVDDDGDLDLF
jgi:signal transduction protein with GAF and PtsI domain